MIRVLGTAVAFGSLSLAGCDQARSTSYFEANLKEAQAVVRNCVEGTHRGQECDNAHAAVSRQRYQAEIKVWDEMAADRKPDAEKK